MQKSPQKPIGRFNNRNHVHKPTHLTRIQQSKRVKLGKQPSRKFISKLFTQAKSVLSALKDSTTTSSPLPLIYDSQMMALSPQRAQVADWVVLLNMPHNRQLKQPQIVCSLEPSRHEYPYVPKDRHADIDSLFHPMNFTLRDQSISTLDESTDPTIPSSNPHSLIKTKASQRPVLDSSSSSKIPDGKQLYKEYMQFRDDPSNNPIRSLSNLFAPEPTSNEVVKYLQHYQWPLIGPQLAPYTMRFTHKGHIIFNHPPSAQIPVTITKSIPTRDEVAFVMDQPSHLDKVLNHDQHTLLFQQRKPKIEQHHLHYSEIQIDDNPLDSTVAIKMPYVVVPQEEVGFHDYPTTPTTNNHLSKQQHQPSQAPIEDQSPGLEHELNKFYRWVEEEQSAYKPEYNHFLSPQQYQLNIADVYNKVQLELSAHRPAKFIFQHKYESVLFPSTQNAFHNEKTGEITTTGNPHDILLPATISPFDYPGFPRLPFSLQHTISSSSQPSQSPQKHNQSISEQTFDTYLSEILPYALKNQTRSPITDPSKMLTIMRNPITQSTDSPINSKSLPNNPQPLKYRKGSSNQTPQNSSNNSPSLLDFSPFLSRQHFTAQFPTPYQLTRSVYSKLYNPQRDQADQTLVPSEAIIQTILNHLVGSNYIHSQLIPQSFYDLIGPAFTENPIDYFYATQQQHIAQIHNAVSSKQKTALLNKSMLYSLSPLFYQIGNNHDKLLPHSFVPKLFHQLREFTYQHHNPMIFQPERIGDTTLSPQSPPSSSSQQSHFEPNQYHLYLFSSHTNQFDEYLQHGWFDNFTTKLSKTKQIITDIDTTTVNSRIPSFHLVSSVLSRPEFNYGLDLLHIRDLFRDPHCDATLHGALIHPITRKLMTSFSATFAAPYDPSFYCMDGFTSELRLYEQLRGEDYVVSPSTSAVPPLLTSHRLSIHPQFKLPHQPLYRNPLHIDGIITHNQTQPNTSKM